MRFLTTIISSIVGVGQVIKGWDEGLKGMYLNEKRKLTIPSHMAYGQNPYFLLNTESLHTCPIFLGSRGFGSVIPPNSALVFTVELVGLDPVAHEEL